MSDTTGWAALDRLLALDPLDGGCAHAAQVMHAYAESLAAGQDPAQRCPEVAAHLRACGPCHDDLTGLLLLID